MRTNFPARLLTVVFFAGCVATPWFFPALPVLKSATVADFPGGEKKSQPAPDLPELKIPAAAEVAAGRVLLLRAGTDCKVVKWALLDAASDYDLVQTGPKEILFVTPRAGTYRIGAWGAKGDTPTDLSVCTVKVTGATPGPGPGPAPQPPEIQTKLEAAWAQEPADQKILVGKLADLYGVVGTGILERKDLYKTAKEVDAGLRIGVDQLKIGGKLKKLQAVCGQEMLKTLGDPRKDVVISDAARSQGIALFRAFSDTLGKLK